MGLPSSPGFFQHRMHALSPFSQNTFESSPCIQEWCHLASTITLHRVLRYRVLTPHVNNEEARVDPWTLYGSIMLNLLSLSVMDWALVIFCRWYQVLSRYNGLLRGAYPYPIQPWWSLTKSPVAPAHMPANETGFLPDTFSALRVRARQCLPATIQKCLIDVIRLNE